MFKKAGGDPMAEEAFNQRATSRPTTILRNQEPTPIGPSMHINGHIRGDQDLIVHGHLEGSINLGEGVLMVTSEGQVYADVVARVITIEGRAEGKLQATEQIIVRQSGRVGGSICAPRIALDFGCAFNGSVRTQTTEQSASAIKDNKIADFKSAISTSSDPQSKPGMSKASPR
jgi:cytoskeletal protein CcmA (bactofilin family)